ncbi:hypothetical protein D3C75_680340 [compost metagenome]
MTLSPALTQALGNRELWFSMTAFLVEVRIECGHAIGRIYADVLERFADGSPHCSAEIESLVMRQGYWTFTTVEAERYVIVSFAGPAGQRSFYGFARLMAEGLFRTPTTVH